jgi:hypothetical protein
MSQSGFTPIQLYRTTTASATPSAGNLADGELAINTTDGKLFYKDNGGVVRVIAQTSSVTNVSSISFGTTGLTPNSTTTGAVTVAGTLGPANGGTGVANNAANTLTFSGNFSTTFTLTGNTSITLPTSGAVATKGNAIAFSIVFGL